MSKKKKKHSVPAEAVTESHSSAEVAKRLDEEGSVGAIAAETASEVASGLTAEVEKTDTQSVSEQGTDDVKSVSEPGAESTQNMSEPQETADAEIAPFDPSPTSSESNEITEETATHKPNNKAGRVIVTALLVIVIIAALCCAAGAIWAQKAFDPIFTEIGDKADLSSLSDTVLKRAFAELVSEDPDTSTLGERSVTVKLFGLFDKQIPVTVQDTVAPEFEVRNVELVVGIEAEAKDFVFSCEDRTEVVFSFDGETPSFDQIGEYDVTVKAVDEGGNTATRSAKLTVCDLSFELNVEFGTSADDIAKQLEKEHPEFDTADLALLDAETVGSCRTSALSEDTYYLFNINIKDTTPPRAERHSFDIRLGEELTIDDFITNVTDLSPTTVSYETEPDFTKVGTQRIKIRVADDQGNDRVYSAILAIHDFKDEITIEAGFTLDELKKALFDKNEVSLRLDPSLLPSTLKLGENTVKLKGNYNEFDVKVTVKDTKAPSVTVHDVTALLNQSVIPASFVTSCRDATYVSYAFDGAVSTSKTGTYKVKIIATDSAGNKTAKSAKLEVILDTEPPVIYGLNTLYVTVGEAVLLKNGVSASDNVDGAIPFTVDSTSLNASADGHYPVYYTAVDSSGNSTTSERTVVVSSIGPDMINRLCDGVLQYIVNDSMTDREKAYAIYNWVTANFRYSTSTSYLMGQYYNAAYSGLNTHAGNCYIYYAVSSALLSRAGVRNMMVQRDDPNNPHYWSLVYVNGSWYHFDTCPHYAAYPFQCFLRTDADVIRYSQEKSYGYYSFDRSLYPATP